MSNFSDYISKCIDQKFFRKDNFEPNPCFDEKINNEYDIVKTNEVIQWLEKMVKTLDNNHWTEHILGKKILLMKKEYKGLPPQHQLLIRRVLGIFIQLEKRVIAMNDTLASRARLFVLRRTWTKCTDTEFTHVATYKIMAEHICDDKKDLIELCNNFSDPVLKKITNFLDAIEPSKEDHENFFLIYNAVVEGGVFVPFFPFFSVMRQNDVLKLLGQLQVEIIQDEHRHHDVSCFIFHQSKSIKPFEEYTRRVLIAWSEILYEVSDLLLEKPFFDMTQRTNRQYIRYNLTFTWNELGFEGKLFGNENCSNPYSFMSEKLTHKPSPQESQSTEYVKVKVKYNPHKKRVKAKKPIIIDI